MSIQFPNCPNLVGEGSHRVCSVIAEHTSGLCGRVVPATCQSVCRIHGPYCGRTISRKDEMAFIARRFFFEFGQLRSEFMERVLDHYATPLDIRFPDEYWPAIEMALSPFNAVKNIYLTGSMLMAVDGHPKDLDIVLQVEDWWVPKRLKPQLPKTINGIAADYFFTTHGPPHDRLTSMLDPRTRTLYLTNWHDVTIKSLAPNITIARSEPLPIKALVESFFKSRKTATNEPEPMKVKQAAKQGWARIQNSWVQAARFMGAIRSRGLLATAADVAGLDRTMGRKVSRENFELRKQSCFAPCPMLRRFEGKRYCGACGCGHKKLAMLDAEDGTCDYEGQFVKLLYPDLKCPLNRPGFVPWPEK